MTVVELVVMAIKNTLFVEIQNGNYNFLKYLCKKFKKDITADEIFSVDRVYYGTPDVQFYYDLYNLLSNDMDKNVDEYISAYVGYYRNTFSTRYNEIQSIDLEKIDKVKYAFKLIVDSLENETAVCFYRMVNFLLRVKDDIAVNQKIYDKDYRLLDCRIPDNKYIREVISDTILEDNQIDLYINRCRKILARKMNLSEGKLNSFFISKLTESLSLKYAALSKGDLYAAIQTLISNNNGGTILFDSSLLSDKSHGMKRLRYIPNMDVIIQSFYEAKIARFAFDAVMLRNEESIMSGANLDEIIDSLVYALGKSKNQKDVEIAKLLKCRSEIQWANAMVDLDDKNRILILAYVDVVYHMFDYTLKKLYEEKLKGFLYDTPVIQQNPDQKKIDTLQQQVEKLEEINKRLSDERQDFKEKYLKQKAKIDAWEREEEELFRKAEEEYKREMEMYPEEYERDQMLLELERQDKERYESEMAGLKRLLKERKEYIDSIEAESQPDINDTEKIPLEKLHLYKYLFVGDLSICGFQNLKHTFRNSTFFEKESADLKNVSADYIVLMTASMSHALFYKLDSCNNLRFIPRIHYNGKTLSGLLDTIASQIYKIKNTETEELDEVPEWEPL